MDASDRREKGRYMAHPNEDLVRRGYDAFSKGDMDTLRDLFHEDASWHVPGRGALAGDYEGIDAILSYFATTMELSEGTFEVHLHDVLANDNHAIGLHVSKGRRDAKNLDDSQVLVFHVRQGKIALVWQHFSDLYAVDDFFA
jgi:uncharacterized protein